MTIADHPKFFPVPRSASRRETASIIFRTGALDAWDGVFFLWGKEVPTWPT
jgi:hypothetical protein